MGVDRGGAWFALRLNLYTFVKRKTSLSIDYRVSLSTRDSVEHACEFQASKSIIIHYNAPEDAICEPMNNTKLCIKISEGAPHFPVSQNQFRVIFNRDPALPLGIPFPLPRRIPSSFCNSCACNFLLTAQFSLNLFILIIAMTAIAVDLRVAFLAWMVISGVMPISAMRWRSSWLLHTKVSTCLPVGLRR